MASGPQPLTSDDLQAKLDSFDSIPLFMKSLPDEDVADNNTLAALQSLAHEGTPDGEEKRNFDVSVQKSDLHHHRDC